jgi:hypothetical protein
VTATAAALAVAVPGETRPASTDLVAPAIADRPSPSSPKKPAVEPSAEAERPKAAPRRVAESHELTAQAPEVKLPPTPASPPPAVRSEPAPSGPTFGDLDVAPPFDQGAAMQALRDAADGARACRRGDVPTGSVRVSVTFARTGRVADVTLDDAALAATSVGSCITSRFRSIQVPVFRGGNMTVRKSLSF